MLQLGLRTIRPYLTASYDILHPTMGNNAGETGDRIQAKKASFISHAQVTR